jgi:hypothetical protein
MRKALSALLLLLVAACGGPQPPDMKDPASVARAFVDAFNARDLPRMLPLVDQVNMDALKAALSEGPEGPAWQGIFNPESIAVIGREQGKVEGPRYDRRDAYMKVGASEDGDVYLVVLARQEDDTWMIVENSLMSEAKFMALSEEPPKKK